MRRALTWLIRHGLSPDFDSPGVWPDVRSLLAFVGLCGVVVATPILAGVVYAAVLWIVN